MTCTSTSSALIVGRGSSRTRRTSANRTRRSPRLASSCSSQSSCPEELSELNGGCMAPRAPTVGCDHHGNGGDRQPSSFTKIVSDLVGEELSEQGPLNFCLFQAPL